MAFTLRNTVGRALTYTELDTNFTNPSYANFGTATGASTGQVIASSSIIGQGGVCGTTVAAQGWGVRVVAGSGDTAGILQFVNYAQNAQWPSLSATATTLSASGNTKINGTLEVTGTLSGASASFTGNFVINNSSPTIYFQDTDHRSCMLHNNSNLFYVLRGDGTNSLTWAAYNGLWPVVVNLENNDFTSGGNVTAYSDIRIKKNIVTIDNALAKTLKLRGIYYNRVVEEDDTKLRRVGVIAQEIQEVLPEVVISNIDPTSKQDTLSVDYGNITALLIEAIKEQQTIIDRQQQQIDHLTELVTQLIK